MRPLLAVASYFCSHPIELVDANPNWIDTDDSAQLPHRLPVGTTLTTPFIVAGPTTESDLRQRIEWATQDPTYAELLELRADADVIANPRPIGYVMVERIQTALGGATQKRKRALAAIGLKDANVYETLRDQSQFDKDRHGGHAPGLRRPPIDPTTRTAVLEELEGIIRGYEEHVFGVVLRT